LRRITGNGPSDVGSASKMMMPEAKEKPSSH
jgi:hypothetical protein